MEPPPSATSTELIWYQYPGGDSVAVVPASAATPVHIDLSSSELAKQINQQMQVHLSNSGQMVLQPVSLVQQPPNHCQEPLSLGVTASSSTGSLAAAGPGITAAHVSVEQVLQEMNTATSKAVKPRHSSGGRVSCQECTKTFSCLANLRDHMRLHTGEKPFKCTECEMEFAQRSNWRLHKRVHTGEKPYMCGICGKTFARSSHLPGHMRIHTGEKPFKCDQCPRYFPSSQALKNHTRTHTGEKPFKCSFCDTAFTHSSSLSSHRKKCNGIKRKRGRPSGTGRKVIKKKLPSGRPRGRPKKKLRVGRGRKKNISKMLEFHTMESAPSSPELEQNLSGLIKREINDSIEIDHACSSEDDPTLFENVTAEEIHSNSTLSEKIPYASETEASETSRKIPAYSLEPRLPIRESVRLRIKQENQKARTSHTFSVKKDPDGIKDFIIESEYMTEQSIVMDHEHEVSDEHESVVLEHTEASSSLAAMKYMSDVNTQSSVIHINASVENHKAPNCSDQQEVAVAMATLEHGVLNLTPLGRQEALAFSDASKLSRPSPLVTYVTPMSLASLSTANQGPLSPSSSDPAPHPYITYHVNGGQVKLPMSLSRNTKVNSSSSNWS